MTGPVGDVSERDWQGLVATYAQFQRWAIYHTFDSRASVPGWPDLVLCRPPELIVVELKKDTGKVTAAQQGWLDNLAASGVEVHVWRPADWAEVEQRLKRVKATGG